MRASRLLVAILVLVVIVVLPAGIALAYPPANPVRTLPDEVQRGETFNVTVNFTAPADDFNSISLRDTAPDGWDVTVSKAWCNPRPNVVTVNAPGNQVSIMWWLPQDEGTDFTAKYKVTVPCGASMGNHSFSHNFPTEIFLIYHIGSSGKIAENIAGEYNVTVIKPTIFFTPTSIDFYGAVNGTNPQNQTVEFFSSTPCMLNWSLSDDADYGGHDWLSEIPASGNCTDEHSSVALSVNTSGMPAGSYSANMTINAPEANNTPEIVPVSLHMAVTGTLEGHVNFAARGSNNSRWIEPFVVKLFKPGTTDVLWEGNRATNNTGVFNITDVVVGTYDIAIKNCTCLSEVVTGVNVTVGTTTVADFGYTREGDIDGDDRVFLVDVSLFCTAWDTKPGDVNWNPNADFDRDGRIWLTDVSLFCSSWDLKGDAYGCF